MCPGNFLHDLLIVKMHAYSGNHLSHSDLMRMKRVPNLTIMSSPMAKFHTNTVSRKEGEKKAFTSQLPLTHV